MAEEENGFLFFSRTMSLATMESLRKLINSFLLLVAMPLMNSFFDLVKLDFVTNHTNRFSSSFVAALMTLSSTSSTLNWCAFISLFDNIPV